MNELFEEVREKLNTLEEQASDLSTSIVNRGGNLRTNLPGMLEEISNFFTGGDGLVWIEMNNNGKPTSVEYRCNSTISGNNWSPIAITYGADTIQKVRFKPTPNALQYKMQLPNDCFNGATALTDVEFYGIKLSMIGNNAFMNCENLKEFDFTILEPSSIPGGYIRINQSAFYNTGLENINISIPDDPDSTYYFLYRLSLDNKCFAECKKLKNVNLTNVENFGSGGSYDTGCFYNSKIETLRIDGSNKSQFSAGNQFYDCEIEKAYISNMSLNSNYVFNHSKIKELYISNCKTNTNYQNTFSNCEQLTYAEIGIFGYMGYEWMANCPELEEVRIIKPTESSLQISQSAFNNCPQLSNIYVSWAEGEVANAPWGATNATIHYNSI